MSARLRRRQGGDVRRARRASGVVNFAHGAFAMVGAFASFEARKTLGLAWTVSLIIAAAFTALIAVVSYLLMQRPLRHASLLTG